MCVSPLPSIRYESYESSMRCSVKMTNLYTNLASTHLKGNVPLLNASKPSTCTCTNMPIGTPSGPKRH